jgi:hypothetical protein
MNQPETINLPQLDDTFPLWKSDAWKTAVNLNDVVLDYGMKFEHGGQVFKVTHINDTSVTAQPVTVQPVTIRRKVTTIVDGQVVETEKVTTFIPTGREIHVSRELPRSMLR